MTHAQHLGSTLAALALTVSLAACTATPTPSPTPSASPTPSPTVTTLTPAEQELLNAKQAVVNLWAVVDRLTNDPEAPIQDLDPVASGQVLTMFQVNLTTYRAQGWKGSGNAIVEDPSASAAQPDAQGRPTWTVTACIDRSNTTLVDQTGKSVQMPPYRIAHRSTVVRIADRYEVDRDEAVGTC